MNIEEIEPIHVNEKKEKKDRKGLYIIVPLLAAAALIGLGKYSYDSNKTIRKDNIRIEALSNEKSELVNKIKMLEANKFDFGKIYNVDYQTRKAVEGKIQDTVSVRTGAVYAGLERSLNERMYNNRDDMLKKIDEIVPGIFVGYEGYDAVVSSSSSGVYLQVGKWNLDNVFHPSKAVRLNDSQTQDLVKYLRKAKVVKKEVDIKNDVTK